MKDLAKKIGLKASQVYKWNWDQKKKEMEDSKLKMQYYPSDIFAVIDSEGKNIARPIKQTFIVEKVTSAKQE